MRTFTTIEKQKLSHFFYATPLRATLTDLMLVALVLGLVGVIGVTMPGLSALHAPFMKRGKYKKYQIQRGLYNLKTSGYVKLEQQSSGALQWSVTQKGWARVKDITIETVLIPQPKKWDRIWRVVIFDMPVTHNKARTAFRAKLKDLGFVQIQKSVWAYPYPCEQEVLFVADFFSVRRYIEIMEVHRFLHEARLWAHFKLM